jgi:LacI family transcriptional regulator, repressor for deo operon, udp, cdd, tsx, nupC, and nupG
VSATIDDVARSAGVSVATVSRALRGLPNVAPSTRDRVLAAAAELQYVAHPQASRLAARRSLTIGLVVPVLGQWFYAQLFSGVEAALAAAGYDVLPYTLARPGGVDEFLEHLPFRKRVDGLIVVDAPLAEGAVDRIAASGLPTLTVGFREPGASSLTVDNVGAARLAVTHLTGLGHRRIAMIGGIEDDPFHFSAPVDRRRGYVEALASVGAEAGPGLVVPGNFSLEGGVEAMHRLLHLAEPPTAVFACSDEMAIGAMQVLRNAGLSVPADVSVVGFDDHDVSEYLGLTTVRQDVAGLGECAADMLLELLRGGEVGPSGGREDHVVHPTRLIVRHSTAEPRGPRAAASAAGPKTLA